MAAEMTIASGQEIVCLAMGALGCHIAMPLSHYGNPRRIVILCAER